MRPMLDDLELPQTQEIAVYDRRALAEHKPPGMDGSLLQNMGRRPSRLVLWGVATGPEALAFVETLDGKYRAGRPVPFIADIVAEAEIEQVAIDNLEWQELAGKPERFAYVLTLREYLEPLEPEDTSFVDTDVLDDVTDIMDTLTAGFEIAEQLSQFIDRLTELNKTLEHEGLGAILPSP
jgi:hypothetical protein